MASSATASSSDSSGSGTSGSGASGAVVLPLTLSLFSSGGANVTATPTVSVGDHLVLDVLVSDASGNPVSNTLVTVQASSAFVSFDPSSGGATTDSSGVASFVVIGVYAGAGSLSVSATIDGNLQSASQAVTVTAASTTTTSN